MAHYDGTIVGTCMNCGRLLREYDEYTNIPFSDGARPIAGLYCKNKCEPIAESKAEEARVTLSEVARLVALHHATLTKCYVGSRLADNLARDYHDHLLSIATVGNLPEQPTERDDDKWISVHDMMPKQAQHVLIWYAELRDDDDAIIASWWPATNHSPESWYDDTGDYRIEGLVTHWQPLPGKPKGLE